MGSFEKLGILVIVVIIVMILAVAIYQWGGTGVSGMMHAALEGDGVALHVASGPEEPEVEVVDYLPEDHNRRRGPVTPEPLAIGGGTDATSANWPGGVPREYVVARGDILWNVVVKRWKLKETFCDAIARANPKVNMRRMRVGQRLEIPNPAAFSRGKPAAKPAVAPGKRPAGNYRIYEIQEGDRLETIARAHLGKRSRWREIVELNPGLSPKRIRAGQKIRLPAR